jgi:hypothetical protein
VERAARIRILPPAVPCSRDKPEEVGMGDSQIRAALLLTVVAWAAPNAGCGSSSTSATAAPFEHDGHFLVNGSHAGLSCIDCHDASAPTFAQAAVDCLRCHEAPVVSPLHQGVAGFAAANAACIDCHRTGTMAVAHEALFPIAAGTWHSAVACAECHGPTRAVADLLCTSCHGGQAAMAGVHGSLAGYAFASPACYDCHRDGGIPGFAHRFPIASGATHGPPMACGECHGATRLAADLACTSCHDHAQAETDARHAGLADYRWSSAACADCHADGRAPPLDHPFPIAAGTPHAAPVLCADCHGATSATADLRCTSCHTGEHARAATDARHAGVAGYAYASPSCYECHPTGSSALPANHDAELFPVTGTVSHGSLGCAQCHGATRGVADLTCIPCHAQAESAAQHAAIPATRVGERDRIRYVNYEWSSARCVGCHADGQVQRIAEHPRFDGGLTRKDHGPICLTCHTATRATGKTWAVDFERWTCLACHTSNNPD